MQPFSIDPEIARAETLPAEVYHDPAAYALQRERIFARSWQLAGDADRLKAPGHVLPFTLLEGCLDEPLVWTCDDRGTLRCLSNVCTHRGTLVVEGEGHLNQLRCRYHGRRFHLDGRFHSMPEFDGVANFPSPADDLPRLQTARFGPLLFCALDPAFPFDEWIEPVRARTAFLPLDRYVLEARASQDYYIQANWALYCDNYLEEFHIPYVHRGSLTGTLDYEGYRTELFRWSNVQLGVAGAGEPAFALPEDHPDAGTRMAAFYFWLFPNLMLNFYPFGLSVNLVQPLGPERTKVSFLRYTVAGAPAPSGAGADLHRVEMEDEEVVEAVQRGVRSRLYHRGRYSPRREVGTHHFHRLLAEFMNGPA
ncbi:MAG TPA: SRPBCC family protein [Longimicrobiales bacterium]|nr:SRPBCC family protein [Longimicrobiales bacterium]